MAGRDGSGESITRLTRIERIGVAAGFKEFGQVNWFDAGADYLMKHQGPRRKHGAAGDISAITSQRSRHGIRALGPFSRTRPGRRPLSTSELQPCGPGERNKLEPAPARCCCKNHANGQVVQLGKSTQTGTSYSSPLRDGICHG